MDQTDPKKLNVPVPHPGSGKDGSTGAKLPDLYVFPRQVVKRHFINKGWGP